MIEYKTGSIIAEDAEALVNTVNCVGVMGEDWRCSLKTPFPKISRRTQRRVNGEKFSRPHVRFETGQLTNPRYIINFPTKRHWRGKSRMSDINDGLDALVSEIRARGTRSSCHSAARKWSRRTTVVRRTFEDRANLERLQDVKIVVFEPRESPDTKEIVTSREVPNMTTGRAALVGLMQRYLAGLMDPFVTLLEVHKLLYFMQEAGEPLQLRYTKAIYGPYAENLCHVLRAVEGHLISGYADGGDAPDKQLELVPGAVPDASAFLEDRLESRARFDQVADLVQGFETPFGLEMLSTVHWVISVRGPSLASKRWPRHMPGVIASAGSLTARFIWRSTFW